MFQKVMLCVDGSEPSLEAAAAAADLAWRLHSELLLVHVFDESATRPYLGAWQLALDEASYDRYVRDVHDAVEAKALPVIEATGMHCRPLRPLGHPAEEIIEAAKREQADLIVAGSRGHGTWRAMLLGSVSHSLSLHAPCPVLIVRGRLPEQAPFHRIVAATDGSPSAIRATMAAAFLAHAYGADLLALNVFVPLSESSVVGKERLEPDSRADSIAAAVAASTEKVVREVGIPYRFAQVTGHAAEQIALFAHEHEADLVVIGSRGQAAWKSALLGSVSSHVRDRVRCSVLIVR